MWAPQTPFSTYWHPRGGSSPEGGGLGGSRLWPGQGRSQPGGQRSGPLLSQPLTFPTTRAPWLPRDCLGRSPQLKEPRTSSPDALGPRPSFSPHLPAPRPVHPSKVSDSEKSQLVNETRWQYYGTPGTQGNLTLTWNTSALPSDTVTIELWGYEETGEAGSGPSAAGVEPLTPTGSLELMDKAERRLQVGGIQPGISSRKMLAGKGNWLEWHRETGGGWLPGYRGWRRRRRSQFLDTRLVLEIGKMCPTPSSRSPGGLAGLGLAPSPSKPPPLL